MPRDQVFKCLTRPVGHKYSHLTHFSLHLLHVSRHERIQNNVGWIVNQRLAQDHTAAHTNRETLGAPIGKICHLQNGVDSLLQLNTIQMMKRP